jgi:hypothetical protein
MASWRRYVYTPPGSRVRDQHELVVWDGRARDGAPLGCEVDGRPISRASAAWVLGRWRKGRRAPGGGLWVTRYGPGREAEPGRRRAVPRAED